MLAYEHIRIYTIHAYNTHTHNSSHTEHKILYAHTYTRTHTQLLYCSGGANRHTTYRLRLLA